jgi:transposase
METQPGESYPTNVTDDEGAFLDPYLTLTDPDAPKRRQDLREVVQLSFAWAGRFRRQARDFEHLPETVTGLHVLAVAYLIVHR